MTLIINADDFGRDAAHNLGIIACMENGWCSSATVMANMPFSDEAFRIVRECGWQDRIGVHLNLTQGQALTHAIRPCSRFCEKDGTFILSRKTRCWRLTRAEKQAVAEELRAQIRRCRYAGLPLTHADSHNHMHEEPGLLPIVISVLKAEKVPFLRITRNTGVQRSTANFIYRCVINARVQAAGLRKTRSFAKSDDYGFEIKRHPGRVQSCEVMIHPFIDASGRIMDSYLEIPIEDCARLWTGKRLSSYAS